MEISSGQRPSNSKNGNTSRKRPKITIRYSSRMNERHVVEYQGGRTENEDPENDAGEGTERQIEETEEEDEEEEAEDCEEYDDGDESSSGDLDIPNVNYGEEVASGRDAGCGGGGTRDGSISMILTDPDFLDCCICCEPLAIPVFQCKNGHIACSTCRTRLDNKCHLCSAPTGHIRCRAIEKVLESVKISCRNARHGCIEKINYTNKCIHEKDCIYTPCWCPFDGCQFTAPCNKLSQHISHDHHEAFINFHYDSFVCVILRLNQKVVVLQEQNDNNLFVLTNDLEHLGNVVKVFLVSPKSPSGETYRYDLYARSKGCRLKLNAFVNHTRGNNFPATTKFLLVPADFLGPSRQVQLEIRIKPVVLSGGLHM